MPRLPIDYSKTIIYKIVCNDLNITDVYVGSTTDFIRRKGQHKSVCNSEKLKINYKVYQTIRENGGWDNFSMIEIEKYPCIDSNEARARERYYLELLNANLNIIIPTRSRKEYIEANKDLINEKSKEYYKQNKEECNNYRKEWKLNNKVKVINYSKEYREANKERIAEQRKEYREANKRKIAERNKKYREANKLKSTA